MAEDKKDYQLFKEGWTGFDPNAPVAKNSMDNLNPSELLNPNYSAPKNSMDKLTAKDVLPQETFNKPKKVEQPNTDEDMGAEAMASFDVQAENLQQQSQVTLASLMNKRKELEQKYNSGMRDQRTMIKIMAIGKLIAALGQLAGGGRGQVFVDKDPYQVNAWKEMDRLRNELRYYSGKLDAQEQAQIKAMTDGLNKIALEKTKLQGNIAIQKAKNAFAKEKLKIEQDYKLALQQAKTAAQKEIADYTFELKMKELKERQDNTMQAIYARGGVQQGLAETKHNHKIKEQENDATLKANAPKAHYDANMGEWVVYNPQSSAGNMENYPESGKTKNRPTF